MKLNKKTIKIYSLFISTDGGNIIGYFLCSKKVTKYVIKKLANAVTKSTNLAMLL
jgi:hypothetical protein